MNYYLVAPLSIARADQSAFTYHSQEPLLPGSIVRLSVGKKMLNGLVLREVGRPKFTTKPVDALVEERPLPPSLVELAQWMSAYYASHLAFSLQTILPAGLHKKRRNSEKQPSHPSRDRTKIVLNADQKAAVKTISENPASTFLLRGITGSGKTAVYIEIAKTMQAKGLSTILLVPEIALTPQLVAEFTQHFENLVITHSGMTEAERHAAWRKCLYAQESQIVIGPRSALFAPVPNLGAIVIDECHEPSFKQEQTPRYSALRAASIRARADGAKLILGSATPSITDHYIAQSVGSPVIRMEKSAVKNVVPADVLVIDQKDRTNFANHRFVSNQLLKSVRQSLDAGEQSLIFHNRRGTAPTTLCEKCAWIGECPNCFIPLTLHGDRHELLCHLCGYSQRVPNTCPICSHPDVIFKGIGTKLIEQELKKLFPKATIARFDADNRADETLQANYQALYSGEIDIIIGTQLLAKGLDLPKLTTVGIVQADSGLMIPDYQSEERVFQLIYQVAGRVGRRAHASRVVLQTFQPNHPAIQLAVAKDYDAFYELELQRRQKSHFPPFVHLLKLTCSYSTENGAVEAGRKLASELKNNFPGAQILGPTPSFYERLGGKFRWQILVKSSSRSQLVEITKWVPPGHWQVDIDPANLL